MRSLGLVFILCLILLPVRGQTYWVYVACESEDEVALVKFNGEQAEAAKRIRVGKWPTENEGPHGVTISPDGKYWYLTMAHGNPFGTLYKYATGTDKYIGEVELGMFPATMQISKASGLLFVVNFNLHGDMVPSTVSIVDPEKMIELKRVTTGVMPHGSRLSPDGRKHYSLAMMSGELFEIDAMTLDLKRTLDLDQAGMKMAKGEDHSQMDHSQMDHSQMDHGMKGMKHSQLKPTWVIPHPTQSKVYVAGNGANEIVEVDLEKWSITQKFPGGKGPYNVEVTPDGKTLVTTYKSEAKTGIWDLEKGKELGRIPNSGKVCHGIAISPDSKYAFVSVEGVGGEPGAVDVIDIQALTLVASADVGKQAGGIAFWKMEE